METTIVYWGYIGIMGKKMETTIVHWGYIGIMEKKMETTLSFFDGVATAHQALLDIGITPVLSWAWETTS